MPSAKNRRNHGPVTVHVLERYRVREPIAYLEWKRIHAKPEIPRRPQRFSEHRQV